MWIVTKKVDHEKFHLLPGMPIPHQNHSGFRERFKEMFGEDSIEFVENVSALEFAKTKIALENIRKEGVRMKDRMDKLEAENKMLRRLLAKQDKQKKAG